MLPTTPTHPTIGFIDYGGLRITRKVGSALVTASEIAMLDRYLVRENQEQIEQYKYGPREPPSARHELQSVVLRALPHAY